MKAYTLDWNKYVEIARTSVAEGCVLLKNDNKALPILKGENVAVFGRIQFDYYKSGTGSGGLVNVNYVHGILDGLKACKDIYINEELVNIYEAWCKENPIDKGVGWAGEPWSQVEMPLSDNIVSAAADKSDIAIIVIGRTAGEDKDNKNESGSYYLSDLEKEMISKVCSSFKRVAVVLNVGNIIDMKWVEEYNPSSVLYAWHGGMEGGMGVADVLTGAVSPSGKLSDTIAYNLSDYPSDSNFGGAVTNVYQEDIYVGYRYFETFAKEKVQYPFGFGLSYTSFSMETEFNEAEERVTLKVTVTNTGEVSGKEVVQVYVNPPQGLLGKPIRNLVAFKKTKTLRPGESEDLEIFVEKSMMASYDDIGVTGHKSCYVLEAGSYELFVGSDVRSAALVGGFSLNEIMETSKLTEAMAPVNEFDRMKPRRNENGTFTITMDKVPTRTIDIESRRKASIPSCKEYTGDRGYKLKDVKNGTVSIGEFLAQLSDEELSYMIKAEGMCSPKVTPGTAAAFGGVTERLLEFGIPAGCCTDGPSGMRLDSGTNAFSLPNGTLLACTFNTELNEALFEMEGLEMRNNRVDTLLGPGINIHRHPLNGRNFEYFSEDPFLTGEMAVAQLKGMHRVGVTGTIKHFCANNQEFKRTEINCIVSERALREIYLKGYEMAVKNSRAYSIMTTYGAVNGVWTAGNYDQNTEILRNEWKYDGFVMTDWWAMANDEGEKPSRENLAAMVRSQNDVYMVTQDAVSYGDNLLASLKEGTLTRGELVRCASNICSFLMRTPSMERMMGVEREVEIINKPEDQSITSDFDMEYKKIDEITTISLEGINTDRGSSYLMGITLAKMGNYRISLTASSTASEIAQIPVTLSRSGSDIGTYSFNGTGGEKVTLSRETYMFGVNHYMKIYFGQSGLKVHSITFEFIG
ncbi:glycoside hydrolase family 3 protein [Clostridium sp. C8-1-8]|uniref:glycoside hydrolase family 3 protein n=1 Tax=Clostridium sp. C8-1-8 TaxID=2698831 RepID=UPI001371A790|nr:glycoside hydrolase family 3 protein [Clostridium sp. C8-1-8]